MILSKRLLGMLDMILSVMNRKIKT